MRRSGLDSSPTPTFHPNLDAEREGKRGREREGGKEREGGREGEREGGREGGREGNRERGDVRKGGGVKSVHPLRMITKNVSLLF